MCDEGARLIAVAFTVTTTLLIHHKDATELKATRRNMRDEVRDLLQSLSQSLPLSYL